MINIIQLYVAKSVGDNHSSFIVFDGGKSWSTLWKQHKELELNFTGMLLFRNSPMRCVRCWAVLCRVWFHAYFKRSKKSLKLRNSSEIPCPECHCWFIDMMLMFNYFTDSFTEKLPFCRIPFIQWEQVQEIYPMGIMVSLDLEPKVITSPNMTYALWRSGVSCLATLNLHGEALLSPLEHFSPGQSGTTSQLTADGYCPLLPLQWNG